MRATYVGHEALTFSDYLDLDTGKTLTAKPGGVYDVAPAGGRSVPEVPEPWFTALEGKAPEPAAEIPAEEAASGPPGEPQPEDGGQQQF